MTHFIRVLEPYADAIIDGRKKFEVRQNDRGYNAGDKVCFRVLHQDESLFLKHPLNDKKYLITYVHSGLGLQNNYVVFGIEESEEEE